MNKAKLLVNDLNTVTMFFKKLKNKYKSNRHQAVDSLVLILSKVPDFREIGKTVYKLENILAICFILSLRGKFTSFNNASIYVKYRQQEFIKLGLIKRNEVPSHDTFRRIFLYLDANELKDAFLNRIKAFLVKLVDLDISSKNKKRLISGDGKTFNGSGRVDKFRNVNVMNVYDASNALCLSSTPLSDKESEIREFQRLLPKFNLSNAIVTGDALHCQRRTCDIILKKKGEYLFTVKDNQIDLKREIEARFNEKKIKIYRKTHNQCHYKIILLEDTYIGCDWPGQKAYVKMVSDKRIDQKDYNPKDQYFISSSNSCELIIETIDNRWQVENELHLFKDTELKEDDCTFTDKNAIKITAVMNNIVYALYRLATSILNKPSVSVTKIIYEDKPLSMLAEVLPLLEGQNLTNLIKENMRGRKK